MATVTSGGGLARKLEEIRRKLADGPTTVEAGFMGGATYPDGTSVAMIAAVQEFGGTMRMPEREQSVYRRIDKDGEFANGGKFVKRAKSNFETTHTVAAHMVTVPPRPFMRNAIVRGSKEWPAVLNKALRRSRFDTATALGVLGKTIEEDIKDSIRSNTPPPNAASTAKAKGFSRTLIDTGVMLNSVTHNVK